MSQILINGVPQSGGGVGNVVSSAPLFTGSLVTTYVPTVGDVINTSIAGNSSDVNAPTAFTFSANPAAGQTWVAWRLTETGGASRLITLGTACLSLARGTNITTFTINANQVAEIRFCWTGAFWIIYGEPATPGQMNAPRELAVAASDETTALTAGTNKLTFIFPYNVTLTTIVGSLSTPQTSGSLFTVDVNEAGVSILSTKLSIDNTEYNSSTAASQAVISDAAIAAFANVTVDIDAVGDGTAKGLKVWLIGYRTS